MWNRKTNPDIATAIRTVVVLAASWLMVLALDSAGTITQINSSSLLFSILSGAVTGALWLCCYCAIQNGVVSIVVPIDKMSILITLSFPYFAFGEKLEKAGFGLCLKTAIPLTMTCFG